MFGGIDRIFDFNHDGSLDPFERACEFQYLDDQSHENDGSDFDDEDDDEDSDEFDDDDDDGDDGFDNSDEDYY